METEFCNIKMELSTMVNGLMISHKIRDKLFMLIKTNTKELFWMEKSMEKESIIIILEENIRASGFMTKNMDTELLIM